MTQVEEPATCAAPVEDGLRIGGVRKSYGELVVLDEVHLDVPDGSLTAVLGPSGCGKTTLLRLVAGFDRPDQGTVHILGREVSSARRWLPPERRRIGYVTQEGNLFPHLTVAANITFGLPLRARRGRHRVPELLELVALDTRYATRYPHELSGGQQQRVALARALAPDPAVLLLDEPFSSLDVELREHTRRAVAAALTAAGATTLLVTHDQAEALSLADSVAVMRDGRIVQQAGPTVLYRQPADRGVAEFVGSVVALPAMVRGDRAECALGQLAVAVCTGPPPAGANTVLLRPEQIVIDPAGVGAPARVLAVDFFGHDALVRLRLHTGEQVTARCPGHQVPSVGEVVRPAVQGTVLVTEAD